MAFTNEGLAMQRNFILNSINKVNVKSSQGTIIKSYLPGDLDITNNEDRIIVKAVLTGEQVGVGNDVAEIELISNDTIIYNYTNASPGVCTTVDDTFSISCVISN